MRIKLIELILSILTLSFCGSVLSGWDKVWDGRVGQVIWDFNGTMYLTRDLGVNPTGDIYEYRPASKSWTKIGNPGRMFTAGDALYGISVSGGIVYRYNGTPMSWTRIDGGEGALWLYPKYEPGVFAEIRPTRDIWKYGHGDVAEPGWERIGGPGWKFSASTSPDNVPYRLYAISPDRSAVYRWEGRYDRGWRKIGTAAHYIYAGAHGVYATNPQTGDIFLGYEDLEQTGPLVNTYRKIKWKKVGGPGKSFAVGWDDDLYGVSPDGQAVYHYDRSQDRWQKIGGPAGRIFSTSVDTIYRVCATSPDVENPALWCFRKPGLLKPIKAK